MSLNNLQLHPQLLADWYSNVLVEGPGQPADVFTGTALGGNKKNILIVVWYEGAATVPDSELQFLISILKACRLTLADVAIFNLAAAAEQQYKQINTAFATQKALLLGATPLQFGLPVHFPHFQIQQFDQCTYLSAPALPELMQDTESKKQLWNVLKRLFDL